MASSPITSCNKFWMGRKIRHALASTDCVVKQTHSHIESQTILKMRAKPDGGTGGGGGVVDRGNYLLFGGT